MARDLEVADASDVPNALMERLSTVRRPSGWRPWPRKPRHRSSTPSRPCGRSSAFGVERELSAVQRAIDRLQEHGEKGADFLTLLQKKLELGRRLAHRRTTEPGYNT